MDIFGFSCLRSSLKVPYGTCRLNKPLGLVYIILGGREVHVANDLDGGRGVDTVVDARIFLAKEPDCRLITKGDGEGGRGR